MGLLIWLAQGATAINIVLLAALAAIWGRNYRQFRSKHTLGMLVFAALLLTENGLSLYYYLWDPFLADWYRNPAMVPTPAMRGMLLVDLLELFGITFLAWVTID